MQSCVSGACSGNALVQNCNDGQQCTSDACAAASGCTNGSVANGTECGARYCNGLEWRRQTCQTGACTGNALQQNCNDGNQCTNDACAAVAGCSNPNASNGTECGSRYCNGLEWRMQSCVSGACSGNALVQNCNDGNQCTSDACAAASGCSNPSAPNGTECGARYCNGLEWRRQTCQTGACTGSALQQNCNDGNVCSTHYCNAGSGCSYVPNTNACSDNDACTVGDYCNGALGEACCQSGPKNLCDDGNICTYDDCYPAAGGCAHPARPGPCDDGDPCTVGDSCVGGACSPGASPCGYQQYCSGGNCYCNGGFEDCDGETYNGCECDSSASMVCGTDCYSYTWGCWYYWETWEYGTCY